MTLMPVSNTIFFGSSVSKSGAVAVDLPVVVDLALVERRTSSGSPITLNTWPSTASPTGIGDAARRCCAPRCRGRGRRSASGRWPAPGCRRSAGRPRPRPRCGLPSIVMSNSSAVLISGTASGGNSTSTTGPAMATTRPSFRLGLAGLGDGHVVISRISAVSAGGRWRVACRTSATSRAWSTSRSSPSDWPAGAGPRRRRRSP